MARYILLLERAVDAKPRCIASDANGIERAEAWAANRLKEPDCHYGDRVRIIRQDGTLVQVVD